MVLIEGFLIYRTLYLEWKEIKKSKQKDCIIS